MKKNTIYWILLIILVIACWWYLVTQTTFLKINTKLNQDTRVELEQSGAVIIHDDSLESDQQESIDISSWVSQRNESIVIKTTWDVVDLFK